ncbi:MAG: hypothetical protein MJZ86_02905 [Bacteroidales bacterium]|nr:hypothetical protein [Bacteroidales bacterium]
MKINAFAILLMLVGALSLKVSAQWVPYYPGTMYRVDVDDTITDPDHWQLQLPKYEPHLSVSTGFFGTDFGDNRLYTSVAPSLIVRPNSKWTLMGGFRITTDMGLNSHYIIDNANPSYAPYKRNGGTGLVSAGVAAQYQVNDNIWLAGSIYHMTGTYAPLYFGNGNVFDVSCTAISAEAAFRFANNNLLHIAFTYINDQNGTMPYMMHDAWMHCVGFGGYGMYTNPCYHHINPTSSYLMPMCY